ncbi:MAG TPA: hypothetical protein VFW66_07790 [Gemmatimonadales bacterium]|nr:hypothetical protein [Gemmatimonadales bacterium]
MLQQITDCHSNPRPAPRLADAGHHGKSVEARVKPAWVSLYPNVDPLVWYPVLLKGEFRDDLEGFWVQLEGRVTYVLARHFDVRAQESRH